MKCVAESRVPKETAEILSTACRPEEHPIVSSQSGRHNVAFCLATRVPLTIVNHPKTVGKRLREKRQGLDIELKFPSDDKGDDIVYRLN